jgi:hypothetical protein
VCPKKTTAKAGIAVSICGHKTGIKIDNQVEYVNERVTATRFRYAREFMTVGSIQAPEQLRKKTTKEFSDNPRKIAKISKNDINIFSVWGRRRITPPYPCVS